MGFNCKVLADSVSPRGIRLTTLEVTFPRIVLAEFNTHRMLSRNSASSRAIPVEKMIRMVEEDPYIPTTWGKNQKGMQADEDVSAEEALGAQSDWLVARDLMVQQARALLARGIHKQLTNRLLEPFMWHTCITTATEWSNFDNLRCHKDAHPEIKRAAELMRDARVASMPKELGPTDWHLPLVFDEDYEQVILQNPTDPDWVMKQLVKISCGRCARVSYLTHEGKRDLSADVELCDRLTQSGHMSPLEHAATPMTDDEYVQMSGEVMGMWGNFRGWKQYRKTIVGEDDMLRGGAGAQG